jgi:MATE family multidrug resistance protein
VNITQYIPFYRRNLALALPIVLSQIGQISVALIDNMMVGHVGTPELAAAAFANNVFMIGMYFGMGITYGLTPLVGKAYGEGKIRETALLLKNGTFTHLITGLALTIIMLAIYFLLPFMGQEPQVLVLARPYYLLLCGSYLPFVAFFTLKQFFEGLGNTKIAMQITLTANLINVLANYVLIFGKAGFPEMGLLGAGIGTLLSRLLMPVLFAWYILKNSRFRKYFLLAHLQKIVKEQVLKALKIGVPIGFQLIVEVTAFGVGAIMMGWMGDTPLAAHQVALGLASFTYMISLGVSQATTIRVSHQLGNNNILSMKRAVYASTHLVLIFMLLMALLFIAGRNILPLAFSADAEVIGIAAQLLIVAAIFQLFDGLQVVMLSTLRGMADVKVPMFIAMVAYLLIGIPTSYIFSFVLHVGPQGIWYGYLVGLGTAGILFYFRFLKKLGQLNKINSTNLTSN